jgi:hypothetical protein
MSALAKNPDDTEARWVLIALALEACDNSFGCDLLRPLVARDTAQVRWLVAAARWVRDLTGVDTTATLRECLKELEEDDPAFGARLAKLAAGADSDGALASRVALTVLAGGRLP